MHALKKFYLSGGDGQDLPQQFHPQSQPSQDSFNPPEVPQQPPQLVARCYDKNFEPDYDNPVYFDGLDDVLLGDDADREYFQNLSALDQEKEIYEREEWRSKHYTRWERRQKKLAKDSIQESSRQKRERDGQDMNFESPYQKFRSAQEMEQNLDVYGGFEEIRPATMYDSTIPETEKESVSSEQRLLSSVESFLLKSKLTFESLRQLQLRRVDITRWMGLDWFEDIMINSLVRFRTQGGNDYCCGRVSRVFSGSVYTIEQSSDTAILSNYRLEVVAGKKKTSVRLALISNQQIQDSELFQLLDRQVRHGVNLPSASYLESKISDIADRRKYKLTSSDISKIVAYQKQLETGGMYDPEIATAHTKPELIRLLMTAKQANDHHRIEMINTRIEEVEKEMQQKMEFNSKTSVNLAALNERLKKRQEAQEDYWAKQTIKATSKSHQNDENSTPKKKLDPFARRKTRPTNLWAGVQSSASHMIDNNDDNEDGSSSTQSQNISTTSTHKLDDLTTTLDLLHRNIDIDIDIDI